MDKTTIKLKKNINKNVGIFTQQRTRPLQENGMAAISKIVNGKSDIFPLYKALILYFVEKQKEHFSL